MIKTGTSHFRAMKISSMVLVLLIPLFLFTIAPIVGEKREIILAKLEQPIYALIVALTFTVGLLHFKKWSSGFDRGLCAWKYEQSMDKYYHCLILSVDWTNTFCVD